MPSWLPESQPEPAGGDEERSRRSSACAAHGKKHVGTFRYLPRQLRAALTVDHAHGARNLLGCAQAARTPTTRHMRASRRSAPGAPAAAGPRAGGVATWHPTVRDSRSFAQHPKRARTAAGLLPHSAYAGKGTMADRVEARGSVFQVGEGGRVGRRLGSTTGRRCLGLKMGQKQSAQSAGIAGVRAGVLSASKSPLARPSCDRDRAGPQTDTVQNNHGSVPSSSSSGAY